MPLFENMNMKSNSKVKKKLLIAAVAVLAISSCGQKLPQRTKIQGC